MPTRNGLYGSIYKEYFSNIFALLKPQLKGIAVQYVSHMSKWNSCTSYKRVDYRKLGTYYNFKQYETQKNEKQQYFV